ncbi:uncharacterized protein PG986_012636 [Apiospora aurea]|uniref:Uncharacterized protein n=1 Tax=Apiospora aurea TaxID=335848 RepID=A0ABR1Q0K3_9PEZI
MGQPALEPKAWQYSDSSIGRYLGSLRISSVRRVDYWDAVGRAREEFIEVIRPQLIKYLEAEISTSNSIVNLSLFMIGKPPLKTKPTVMFVSEDKKVRKEALDLVKKSHFPLDYPGFAFGECRLIAEFEGQRQIGDHGDKSTSPSGGKTLRSCGGCQRPEPFSDSSPSAGIGSQDIYDFLAAIPPRDDERACKLGDNPDHLFFMMYAINIGIDIGTGIDTAIDTTYLADKKCFVKDLSQALSYQSVFFSERYSNTSLGSRASINVLGYATKPSGLRRQTFGGGILELSIYKTICHLTVSAGSATKNSPPQKTTTVTREGTFVLGSITSGTTLVEEVYHDNEKEERRRRRRRLQEPQRSASHIQADDVAHDRALRSSDVEACR